MSTRQAGIQHGDGRSIVSGGIDRRKLVDVGVKQLYGHAQAGWQVGSAHIAMVQDLLGLRTVAAHTHHDERRLLDVVEPLNALCMQPVEKGTHHFLALVLSLLGP